MEYTLERLKKMMEKNGGSLYLRGTSITSLPEGLTVGGWLDLEGCTSITSLPEGLTVGGWLNLRGTSITSLPEGLTVGGSLYIRGASITSLPEGLTVGGWLNLRGTSITSLPEGLTVGGWLDLRGTSITSLPEGLTVGGWLDLEGCTSITSLPEGLTVGGWLNLRGTSITSLPEGLTVGGSLYIRGASITNPNHYRRLQNGEYAPGKYIYADGILTHVKRMRKVRNYTYYIGKIKRKNVIFDGQHYAHCADLKSGIADLAFKSAKDRGAEQYKSLTRESVVKREDAIVMYRIITGACAAGTQAFIDSLGGLKDEYTIAEIIDMTAGHYGAETFKRFFE